MKESVQKIEDYYISLGYRGEELRKTLTKDKGYQKLLQTKGGNYLVNQTPRDKIRKNMFSPLIWTSKY